MMADAGASAVSVHGRTAADAYRGRADWDLIARVVAAVSIPVFGNGDLVEAPQVLERWRSSGAAGVLVGRGVLRNPWICAQAQALAEGRAMRQVSQTERGRFLLDYIDLLLDEPEGEPAGFRHQAPGRVSDKPEAARGRERWVINKLRALAAWYTKGFDHGARLREAINAVTSLDALRDLVGRFFIEPAAQSGEWSPSGSESV
jgi:tRNA-dihydrouridine synthase B